MGSTFPPEDYEEMTATGSVAHRRAVIVPHRTVVMLHRFVAGCRRGVFGLLRGFVASSG